MRIRRRIAAGVVATAASALALTGCTEASGGDFPSEDITLVVPYDAGGGTDSIARAIQPHLQDELGVTVLVENRPGGSGAVATNDVLSADPDGYTMIMAAASPTIATPLFSDVGYGPEDLSLIGQAVPSPNVIVVTEDSPYQTADEMFAAAEAGEPVLIGVPGATSMQAIAIELINAELGTDAVTAVPFDGSAGSVAALQAGDVDASMGTTLDVASVVEGGIATVIAATNPEDVPELLGEDIPSLEEQGVIPPAGSDWYGIGGPDGLPEDVVTAWTQALEVALQEEEVVTALENLGAEPGYMDPAEFEASVKEAWDSHAALFE